jgi:hypothetical protein
MNLTWNGVNWSDTQERCGTSLTPMLYCEEEASPPQWQTGFSIGSCASEVEDLISCNPFEMDFACDLTLGTCTGHIAYTITE